MVTEGAYTLIQYQNYPFSQLGCTRVPTEHIVYHTIIKNIDENAPKNLPHIPKRLTYDH